MKLLYVCDTTLDEISPISDVLRMLLRLPVFGEFEKLIVQPRTNFFDEFEYRNIEGYNHLLSTQSTCNYLKREPNVIKKVAFIWHKVLIKLKIKRSTGAFATYFKKIKKVYNYNFVLFLVNSPRINVTRWLKKKKINYLFFLHSTWIADPRFKKDEVFILENEIIKDSVGYFIPSFFFQRVPICLFF